MLRTRSSLKQTKQPPAPRRPTTLEPLSDAEFNDLGAILADTRLGGPMNVEQLDGFFLALLVGPFVEKPCQYWPVVLGKDVGDPATLDYIRTTTVLLPLFARHWDTIAQALRSGRIHMPYLILDRNGTARASDWARGFLRAVELRAECWRPLLIDDDYSASLLPMMILAHENDAKASLRSPALSGNDREGLILQMMSGSIRAYRFFAETKDAYPPPSVSHFH